MTHVTINEDSGQPELTTIVRLSWYNFCPKQLDISVKLCRLLKGNRTLSFKPFCNIKGRCPRLSCGSQNWGYSYALCSLYWRVRMSLVVLFFINYVQSGAALLLPLCTQLIMGTCPTLVSLRLQAYLWLLCQTLESLWSPGPDREAPGQQLFLQVACISPMFFSGDSGWVFCNVSEHTLETGCGSWINARLYNKNKWLTLRQAALL